MHVLIFTVLIALLSACRPAQTQMPATTTLRPLGTVSIDEPAAGAVIYSEVVHISGTVSGLPDERFVLVLTASDDEELARMIVHASEGQWQLNLPHGYDGVPSEVMIAAYPADSNSAEPYDQRIVAMAGLAYRPDGAYAQLDADLPSLGGDSMPVSGVASGLGNSPLTLRLLTPDRDLISETSIIINDPSGLNEIPWTNDLDRNDNSGPALLELSDATGEVLDTAELSVAPTAG